MQRGEGHGQEHRRDQRRRVALDEGPVSYVIVAVALDVLDVVDVHVRAAAFEQIVVELESPDGVLRCIQLECESLDMGDDVPVSGSGDSRCL